MSNPKAMRMPDVDIRHSEFLVRSFLLVRQQRRAGHVLAPLAIVAFREVAAKMDAARSCRRARADHEPGDSQEVLAPNLHAWRTRSTHGTRRRRRVGLQAGQIAADAHLADHQAAKELVMSARSSSLTCLALIGVAAARRKCRLQAAASAAPRPHECRRLVLPVLLDCRLRCAGRSVTSPAAHRPGSGAAADPRSRHHHVRGARLTGIRSRVTSSPKPLQTLAMPGKRCRTSKSRCVKSR